MKIAVIIAGLALWGSMSHAQGIITDLFECRAKIVNLKTNESAESVGIAAGNRIVTSTQQPTNFEMTTAEAELSLALNGQITTYKVDFNLHYGFAKRPVGNPTEARQYVCNQVSLQSCQNGQCSAASDICVPVPDPFDPTYGWSVTSMIQNVPMFNEQLLRPLDTIMPISPEDPNGAHVTVSCKFKGTYF